ncbi:MAG: serine/threonine-protein phosphatase [candidate division Zixibacteria bacterium]|nr:serine/threonine-protein phosphatase [candidate division Zixibacteria bacterium]
MADSNISRARFTRSLPFLSKLRLYLAVVFTFATLGVLWCIPNPSAVPWYGIATWMTYSGLVALGWAWSFTHNRKMLFVVIPFSALAPALLRDWFVFLPGTVDMGGYLGTLAILCLACIVVGYVLFISFISTEGARTVRLQTEISLAQQVHSHLVPPIDMTNGRFEFYGRSDSSSEVGGDLLDVVAKDGRIGVFVADVSGHGVRAGVLMAMIKSAARMRLLSDNSLDGLMDDLNRVVLQVKEMDMFVTVACLQFDDSNAARFLLAGHPSILHYRNSTKQIDELESSCPPSGVVANLKHASTEVRFDSGDLFILLTDGLLEVENTSGEQFGQSRIESLIKANAHRPLKEIFQILFTAVRGHGPQDDDQTLLLIRAA